MSETKYEIDFLPVGDGQTSGDAIALRYGTGSELYINVVDGGTSDSGDALVEHINSHYNSPSVIDNVICTHPDDDHTSGLRKVMENFQVENLWIHRPWLYAEELKSQFKGNWTTEGLQKKLKECFPIVSELEDMAYEQGTKIHEPFQGAQFGAFIIASPSKEFYLSLVPQFSRTPEPKEDIIEEALGIFSALGKMADSVLSSVADFWDIEYITGGETSPSNESSVVQYANFAGRRVLLTGDAGVKALDKAADYLEDIGVDLPGFRFAQVPHHGSGRNISTDIMDRLFGEIVSKGSAASASAFVSAAKEDKDHPRKKVTNAFIRRGYNVFVTEGGTKHHYHNFDDDRGWSLASPLPFYDEVEDDKAA